MSVPFELINLSKDLKLASIPYSGWPPPITPSLIQSFNQFDRHNVLSTTIIQDSIPLPIDQTHYHRKLSRRSNGKSYFEKLRSAAQDRYNEKIKSHLTTTNVSTLSENLLDDMLENLIGSIPPCSISNSDDMNNIKSQIDIVLSKLELFKQIYMNNEITKSIKKEEFKKNTQQCSDIYTCSISTPHGNIFFDFSKQSINYDIYIQLLQLVRLSNLDKYIEKIFHKSGEYHHVNYKEKRQNQLEKEQENYDHLSDYLVHRLYQDPTVKHFTSHSVSSHSSVHNKYQLSNNNDLLKLHRTDKTNRYITMAKAVHFRATSHCFVLDNIDISSRFQYDRNILRDTCLLFHNYVNNDSLYTTSLSDCNSLPFQIGIDRMITNSKRTMQFILVLCTQRMRKIYRLLELLFKPYILPNISIVYITFDQIKPFLIKYEQMSHETFQKDEPTPFDFQNSHNISSSIEENILNQSAVLLQSVGLKEEFNTNAEVNSENITTSTSEKNLLNLLSQTDITTDKIDLSNEKFLLNYLRASSLVLIFMKHLDESYLTAFIRWYTESLRNSNLHSNQSLISSWNKAIEHFWLITSDYQHAQTVFNIPKTNLFLWPTEHNDIDYISIIISSILILPITLSINYEIYTMFIDGMSIIDKHCQETTFDQNICIQMALLRIWSTICERKSIAIITCDDHLQYFGEYVQMLLTEYDYNDEHKMIARYASIIHGISLAKTFLQQISNERNHFSYDLIAIQKTNIDNEQSPSLTTYSSQNKSNDATTNIIDQKLFLNPHVSELLTISTELYQIDKISHPHTTILLDQLTPLTLGVLAGVNQMSIFFENIIRENIFQLNDQPKLLLSEDKIFNQHQENLTFDLINETN